MRVRLSEAVAFFPQSCSSWTYKGLTLILLFRSSSKSPRKDLTPTLNNIGPPKKQPAKVSDDDETGTSCDSAEERAESPATETLNKTLTKSPV